MRVIGHVPNERSAAIFSDYLVVQGIANQVEPDREGWAVWIHAEDEMPRARELLDRFLSSPGDPTYQRHVRQAQAIKEQRRQEAEAAEQRHFHRRRLFPQTGPLGIAPLTFILIGLCLVVALVSNFGRQESLLRYLFISVEGSHFPEIARGQVWRLLTPILIHFGILHLGFNMLWLFDLGAMIEGRLGTRRFAVLVAVIGVVSNVGQYLVSTPIFGGMSGVVYGLLGYVWMKGKFDPGSGLFLHPQTVAMMLIWFVLCLTGVMGHVANVVHGVGLALGISWGFLSSRMRR